MRSLVQLAVFLLSFITLSSAWPWPPAFVGNGLSVFKRQDNNNGGNGGGNGGTTSSQSTNQPTRTSGSPTTRSGTETGTITGTDSRGTTFATSNATETEYDPRDPAGGIVMITPAATAGLQYYKVGDWVHFAWNYTSLSATPTAINVIASCSKNQGKYTLGSNMSVQETGQVFWDTSKATDPPLLTEKYSLYVWDADQPMNAPAKPGYLAVQNPHAFAMYTPQPYTPWSDFQCPTCNAAMSSTEKLTLKFLLGTIIVTTLSFTWFANSFSII